MQFGILGFVYYPHLACAELLNDSIVAERFPDHKIILPRTRGAGLLYEFPAFTLAKGRRVA